MRLSDRCVEFQLEQLLINIGEHLDNADTISIFSPIIEGTDKTIDKAINALQASKGNTNKLAIILQTPGGEVEVVERMVETIRHFYKEVTVIVPDKAMSAGTILALSADHIMMNYFSRLGPIDPQVYKGDGRLIPALSYLIQYERFIEKAQKGELTMAEHVMLEQLDLGELYQCERARELSVELLTKWLSQYKFKDWKVTETRKKPVTPKTKEARAKKIANLLNDTERWHSHGRGINMDTLRSEIELKIKDYSDNPKLSQNIGSYFNLLTDYMEDKGMSYFIQAKEHFYYD